jgi:hypothetical protein
MLKNDESENFAIFENVEHKKQTNWKQLKVN